MVFNKLLKKLMPMLFIAMLLTVTNSISAEEVKAAAMNNFEGGQEREGTNMIYYNFDSRRGDEALLDKTKITVTNLHKSLPIEGIETIALKSTYINVSIVLEDREDISADFSAEGKFSDNFLLNCSQESGIASIAVEIKNPDKPMQLKSLDLKIHIPLSFKGDFDLKSISGALKIAGDINCKAFKIDTNYCNISFANILSSEDVEIICLSGTLSGGTIKSRSLSIQSKYLTADLGGIEADGVDLKSLSGNFTVSGDINCKDFKIDTKYCNVSFNNILSSEDVELICLQGKLSGGNIKSEFVSIQNQYMPADLGEIEAKGVTIKSQNQNRLKIKGITSSGLVDIDSRYTDIEIQRIDAKINSVLNNSDIFLKFMLLNNDITISGAYSDISIFLPEEASFNVNCSTRYGDINNSFGIEVKEDNHGIGAQMSGIVNSGKQSININMNNSDIILAK